MTFSLLSSGGWPSSEARVKLQRRSFILLSCMVRLAAHRENSSALGEIEVRCSV